MKNFCFSILIILLIFLLLMLSSVYFAGQKEDEIDIGILGYLGFTNEDFQNAFDAVCKTLRDNDSASNDKFVASIMKTHRKFYFCNSLMELLMELNSGRVDEIILPESCGKYILRRNSGLSEKFPTKFMSSKISFGFREDCTELKNEFDAVINEMENDGTLALLKEKYITHPTESSFFSVTPKRFENAPVLKIAVTGDMPPLDMFAGDGEPTGYNTAVLAEIGRRLKKNIRLVTVSTGGRTAALSSGKVDVVFWYRKTESTFNSDAQDPLQAIIEDNTAGVILSVPYYAWKTELVIYKTPRTSLESFFSS